MCVIIVCPKGKDISREILLTAIERNPHGWGMSSREGSDFAVYKGWDESAAWKKWQHMGNKEERVFHARIATHGEINLTNLHPFDASHKEEKRVFYHNGTVSSIPQFDDKKSDSWHVATFLKSFPSTKKILDEVQALARKEVSRFVLATPKETWYFGSGWITREDVLYSNGSALGGIQHKRRAWAGGLLHSEGTISDTTHEGFTYDTESKVYKPDPKYVAPTVAYDEAKEVSGAKAIVSAYAASGYKYSESDSDWAWWNKERDSRYGKGSVTVYEPRYNVAPHVKDSKTPFRWADEFGNWWESCPKNTTDKYRVGVEGPHPGSVVYKPCLSNGIGSVYNGDGTTYLGKYDYKKLTPYIIREFKVLPPQRPDESALASVAQAEAMDRLDVAIAQTKTGNRKHELTVAEWEAIEQADTMPEFRGWSDKQVIDHFRANGGTLHPVPVT